jgi:choline-sulfatase
MENRNILVILTDQLAWRALPVYGDKYAQTPAIDSICKDAAVFDACYTPCPLCQPARTSFWTGIYPHETNVLSNGLKWPVQPVPSSVPAIGEIFSTAGYHTIHFGKKHDAGGLRGFTCSGELELPVEPESDAFPLNMDTFRDRYTAGEAVKFLKNLNEQNPEGKPFFMIADFVNPHNICGFIGAFAGAHENPRLDNLPELPPNFDFDDFENRPIPVQYICCSHNRQAQTAKWTADNFRHYLAAYYRYLKYADDEIQKVLDTLAGSGRSKNTLVVFMSDHGDSMASRHRVTKQVDFYEEVSRVPFVFKGPGVKSRYIKGGPVSLLDLFPTLCGYAGIETPKGLRGKDLSGVLRGEDLPDRKYVVSQWHTEWGYTVEPGRMLVTGRYKYIKYLEGQGEELYDLEKDPWEKTNLAGKSDYAKELAECRILFKEYLDETGDDFETLEYGADKRWRSHEQGYEKHEGLAAPAYSWEKYGKPFGNARSLSHL